MGAASLTAPAPGDTTALDDYDQHGRILGAPPDEAMDQAARAYVARYLAGRDVILTAADWARCRELSTRIRDDLIHLGLIDGGRSVRIAEGADASAGDLIICRQNDHAIQAGEPDRALANGDILRIEAITEHGVMVRRLIDADPATGRRRFTAQTFPYPGYQSCDLAYAVTGHSAQGGTVHTGITLVTGTEDRQWLYSAMTRGTQNNMAFVFTTPARQADPQPGTRPAPELDRYRLAQQKLRGFLPAQLVPGPASPDLREQVAVLADVLARDGSELSASETWNRNLSNADHLGTLNVIWTAETRDAQNDRYRALLLSALPPQYRPGLSHQAKWLFRTLRTAELASLDPGEVARSAIESRDLTGARDIASVVDARIRHRIYPLLPQPQRSWSERVPVLADPERQAYLTEIAAMMDDRKQRLGQFAAEHTPPWAVTALGPVPGQSVARHEWKQKASSIAAYREMYGYDHPDDPIGPEPASDSPDMRTAWHEAFRALEPADGPDVRGMPDGRLWLIRDAYTAETQWAPRHVGKELRLLRLGAQNAEQEQIRAEVEAEAARKQYDHQRAAGHDFRAASYQAMANLYRQQEETFVQAMHDRREWEQATAASRHVAIAADTELRRRRPNQHIEPLHSAEPIPASQIEHEELTLALGADIGDMAQWIQDLAAQSKAFREKLEHRQGLMLPSEDPDREHCGPAFPFQVIPACEAILQPPKSRTMPSAKIMQALLKRDAAPEAAT